MTETVTKTEAVTTLPTETSTSAVTTTTSETVTTTTTTATTSATTTTKAAQTPAKQAPTIKANAAVLYCYETGEVLFSKELDKKISLASITKLLSASVALKKLGPDYKITVGTEIKLVHPNSTLAFLSQGTKMPLNDLIYGLLLPSGNDAAYTLAVNTARAAHPEKTLSDTEAVSVFVGMMNSFASELGMSHSHFASPEGWDDPQNYTTLSDLMKLINYSLGVDAIRTAAGTYQKTVRFETGGYAVWTNTNQMLDPNNRFYDKTVCGLKTGTTDNAGCCVATVFSRGGKTYVCVIMGAPSKYELYTYAKQAVAYYLG